MMDIQQVREKYDRQQRIDLVEPQMDLEITTEVVRAINKIGKGAWIAYSWLTEENIERVIEEQIAFFETLGRDFEWKVYSHDWPPDLKDRLATRGFSVDEDEAIMVADLKEAPPALFNPPASDVRLISKPHELDAVLDVQRAVWGRDYSWLRDELTVLMTTQPDYLRVYAAYADGMPVSSAWIRFHQDTSFASLWGGSTVPAYRGRGLYRDLLAARAIEARRRGFRYLTLDASPMSRPIVERLGFQQIATANACEWKVQQHKKLSPSDPAAL